MAPPPLHPPLTIYLFNTGIITEKLSKFIADIDDHQHFISHVGNPQARIRNENISLSDIKRANSQQ